MAPRTGQRQEVAFRGGGLGGRGWCSDGQGLSPGLIGEGTQHRERRPEMQPGEAGARAPGARRERGHRGAASGCIRGGGRGRFQEAPRVSLELRPRYSIG